MAAAGTQALAEGTCPAEQEQAGDLCSLLQASVLGKLVRQGWGRRRREDPPARSCSCQQLCHTFGSLAPAHPSKASVLSGGTGEGTVGGRGGLVVEHVAML